MPRWEAKRLSEICRFQRGLTYAKSDEVESPGHTVLRANNIDLASHELDFTELKFISSDVVVPASKLVRPGSLLVCTASGSKAHLGKVAYIDADYGYAFGGFMGQLTPLPGIYGRYLFHVLNSPSYKRFIDALSDGVNINNLKFDDLGRFPVPLPPIGEQRRIVSVLDDAFEAIATAKANAEYSLVQIKELFHARLDCLMRGERLPEDPGDDSVSDLLSKIKAVRVERSKRKERLLAFDGEGKTETAPCALPTEWRWLQLQQLSLGISDGVHKTPRYVSEGIPFITVKNLTAGPGISFDDLNYITRQDHEEYIKRTHPEQGDILITKDGTIGVVRLVDTDREFSIFVSVALVKPALRELGPFLAYALCARSVQNQIIPQGAALKHLYLADLRRLLIPVPPLREQGRIVAHMDVLTERVQQLTAIYKRKVSALNELKQSLLERALTGEPILRATEKMIAEIA